MLTYLFQPAHLSELDFCLQHLPAAVVRDACTNRNALPGRPAGLGDLELGYDRPVLTASTTQHFLVVTNQGILKGCMQCNSLTDMGGDRLLAYYFSYYCTIL